MKTIKRFILKNAGTITSLALAMSFSTGFGQHCRTWFYQPRVPQRDDK